MLVLEKIYENYKADGNRVAYESQGCSLTYKELWEQSDRLALLILERFAGASGKALGESTSEGEEETHKPIVVFGHKKPEMLVSFLACAKAGHPYCPVDTSMPESRIKDILQAVGTHIVLATEPLDAPEFQVVYVDAALEKGAMQAGKSVQAHAVPTRGTVSHEQWLRPEDVFYIIFTSGSTGKPKGVEITCENLSRFTDWSEGFFEKGARVMNQAPFSFDLSVMDTYTSMTRGCSLYGLPKEMQKECGETLEFIQNKEIQYMVSTPSFVNMLLADQNFNEEAFPNLKQFLFCGEKLTEETVKRIYQRFPNVRVINTYGPTESTVAVTSVEITKEMADSGDDIPIGVVKPGSQIVIEDEEIIICGDTVSPGYFKDEEKTRNAFFEKDGTRCYKTGDKGYFKGDMLYYIGRKDNQIKLHGYRIELGDIEANLMGINGITEAVVLPKVKDGVIRSLTAFVVRSADESDLTFQEAKAIKSKLSEKLPAYMIPKKIRAISEMPRNNNGKADRKELEKLL